MSLSLLYWLKMLGIFLAVLLTLALMTLVTCRRPRKRADIEVSKTVSQTSSNLNLFVESQGVVCFQVGPDCPTPVFEPEEPPGYDALMETELRELPSYLEAVCGQEPGLSSPVSSHRV